jgi:hypothetical protein
MSEDGQPPRLSGGLPKKVKTIVYVQDMKAFNWLTEKQDQNSSGVIG